jgi:hypothetical protein
MYPVPILGLQCALGAEKTELQYFRGRVSYQVQKLPPEVRRTGKLGEGRVKILRGVRDAIEYEIGSKVPKDTLVYPQEDILKDITERLGLERREEALGINIKERLVIEKVPEKLRDFESLQGFEDLYHLERSAGDYTDVVKRALVLPRGFLRSFPRLIRSELVDHEIVKPNDPVLRRIRSVLRTIWIIPEEGGWSSLKGVVGDVLKELTAPHWWEDVGIPVSIRGEDGGVFPMLNVQVYRLFRRPYRVAVQLPEGAL